MGIYKVGKLIFGAPLTFILNLCESSTKTWFIKAMWCLNSYGLSLIHLILIVWFHYEHDQIKTNTFDHKLNVCMSLHFGIVFIATESILSATISLRILYLVQVSVRSQIVNMNIHQDDNARAIEFSPSTKTGVGFFTRGYPKVSSIMQTCFESLLYKSLLWKSIKYLRQTVENKFHV